MLRLRGTLFPVVGLGLSLWHSPAPAAAAIKQDDVDRIIAAGRAESQVMDHLDALCNRIGPRLTGSDQLQNACEWTRERFVDFGLENARLEAWGSVPVGFNRGPWMGRVVEPEERALQFVTPAWTAGTKGILRGKAVLAPINEEGLEKVEDSLKGAWVVSPLPERGGGPRPTPVFLEKLGKVYDDLDVAGIVRPARGDVVITDGNYRVSWDKLPTIPSVKLRHKQFDEVVGWLKGGKTVTLEFDIRNYFKKGPIKQYNVVAEIPGSDKPDEFVIVGGHLDSWDGATGATDNGTGIATTLEAARILAKAGVKPRRSIRFMLWSGEEQGLLGSRAYVKAHPELLPKVSAVLVHDGGTNYLSSLRGTEAMMSDFQQVFAPVMSLDPKFPFEVKKVSGLAGSGSDHASFLSENVPGFFWGQTGKAAYSRTHHTQFDTYDAAVPEYQKHSSLVVALGAFGIAELDHLLSREKLRAPGMRRLGVQLDALTVTSVIEDGVAEKGGMLTFDVILKIDGAKVSDYEEVSRALQAGEPKKKVVVIRDGKEVELTLDWGPPPKK
jgi:carboxypeptidase Q